MLNKSTCISIPSIDDKKGFDETNEALNTLGVPKDSQEQLYKVVDEERCHHRTGEPSSHIWDRIIFPYMGQDHLPI